VTAPDARFAGVLLFQLRPNKPDLSFRLMGALLGCSWTRARFTQLRRRNALRVISRGSAIALLSGHLFAAAIGTKVAIGQFCGCNTIIGGDGDNSSLSFCPFELLTYLPELFVPGFQATLLRKRAMRYLIGVFVILALGGEALAQTAQKKQLTPQYCVDRCQLLVGHGGRNDYSACMSQCYVWLHQRDQRSKQQVGPTARKPAAAQDFRAIHKRYIQLRVAGDHDAALIEAQKLEAAVKARLGTTHRDYGVALLSLANAYTALGRHEEAQVRYEQALKILEKARSPNHPEVASALRNLGINSGNQGQHAKAEEYYRRAMAILEKAKGENAPELIQTLVNLSSINGFWGQN
jgi:hypothetical protein